MDGAKYCKVTRGYSFMIKQLLQDHKITKNKVFDLISSLSETGGEYCDLYFQHSVSESWLLDDGIVKGWFLQYKSRHRDSMCQG